MEEVIAGNSQIREERSCRSVRRFMFGSRIENCFVFFTSYKVLIFFFVGRINIIPLSMDLFLFFYVRYTLKYFPRIISGSNEF